MSLNTLFSESSTKSSKTSAKSSSKSAESSTIEVDVLVIRLAVAEQTVLRRAEAVELRGGGGVGEAEDQKDQESGDLHAGIMDLDELKAR